ncbi:TerD family protein [Streptomyces sp. NPDC001212]|uniref:TerD family protein n=1 Tax=unclassified Streptomyces TaxID=2593676 RepID=UPI003682B50B
MSGTSPLDASAVDVAGLEAALREAVDGEVRFDAGSRGAYATDGSNYRQVPIGVVVPRTVEAGAEAVRVCARFGAPGLSRGGGTSLAGQTTNTAVVIDWTKYCQALISVDPDARTCVVEPGIVLDALNQRLSDHTLQFGPKPSTHSHCALGGMIGNNSCGASAQAYGKTVDNVRRLEVPHDARDDVRVLSGVLHGSLDAAEQLGLPLPLLTCPPRQDYKPYVPKTPCAYRNPGRLAAGGPLVQGMKVAITGDTQISREELVARSVAAGLNMMTSVSGQTSVVVTNDPGAASGKLRRATAEGVPLVDEPTYLRLLENVQPGQAKGTARIGTAGQRRTAETPGNATTAQATPAPNVPAQRTTAPTTPTAGADRSLAGRRVLVLGGTHQEAAAARARVVDLGASAAVNLSARVTDIVVLPGGESDRRMSRIASLGLRVHDADWLLAPAPAPIPAPAQSTAGNQPDTADVLVRGAVIDLPDADTAWTVAAAWGQHTTCEVDVVAFALDAHEQVAGDEDFVFYGAPEHPDGTVRLATDGPTEQAVTADLERLPLEVHRVVIAAAIDGTATFSDIGAIEITATGGIGAAPTARATLDAATTERTMILAEIYRRGDGWRLRAVGQGYDHGLADLARGYGVDVAE